MLKVLMALTNPPEGISEILEGHEVDMPGPGHDLADMFSSKVYDIVFLEGPLETVSAIKNSDPRIEIIHFGGDSDGAVEAVRLGASAYFAEPVDLEGLRDIIDRIVEDNTVRRETAELQRLLNAKYTFSGIVVGKNPKMLDIFSFIKRIALYYKTVLITGETGTGKEVIAKALHETGSSGNQFIVCNCGGLTESLVESELFGHKKGSFTGALSDRAGLFEAAGEGNIFLDEIGEMPLSFQPHFLRVLQNGEFRQVGGNRVSRAKCRVIAATNRDLEYEVDAGRFRKDLYFRLTPLTIHLPPLRERKDDIPLLCRFLLDRFNQRTGKDVSGISLPAQSVLMNHDWPGNIRELESVIEEAAILTKESFIRLHDLPANLKDLSENKQFTLMSLDDAIKGHVSSVLKQCGGNRTRAAKKLGLSRRSLLRKIEKYGIR
jgi:DNA-binding NtrC family response regulator